MNNFSLRLGIRQRYLLLTLLFNVILEILPRAIRQKKKKNKKQSYQKEINHYLRDNITIYIEKPKESTKRQLELTSEFSKAAGYKVTTQKSVIFPYTSN